MFTNFDFEKALSGLRSGKNLTGKDGVLMPLIKQLTEAAITAELEHHITHSDEPNRKNGTGSKTIKTGSGSFELNAPRDRTGSFEPQLIKKNKTHLTPEIDCKILSLLSHGMSYRDIQYHIQDLYGVEISTGAMTAVTDQLVTNFGNGIRRMATKAIGEPLPRCLDGSCTLQSQ